MPIIYCRCREFIWNLKKDGLTFFPWIHRHFWALSKIKTLIRKYFVKCSLPGFHQVLVAIFMIPLATGFGPTSPQPVMSQPYPVPIPLPQPKSRPLPDSRGIPDTLNLFFFGKHKKGIGKKAKTLCFKSVISCYIEWFSLKFFATDQQTNTIDRFHCGDSFMLLQKKNISIDSCFQYKFGFFHFLH